MRRSDRMVGSLILLGPAFLVVVWLRSTWIARNPGVVSSGSSTRAGLVCVIVVLRPGLLRIWYRNHSGTYLVIVPRMLRGIAVTLMRGLVGFTERGDRIVNGRLVLLPRRGHRRSCYTSRMHSSAPQSDGR